MIKKINAILLCVVCMFSICGTLFAVASGPYEYLEIQFDANGGIGVMTPQKIDAGKRASLKNCDFSREGYGFAGWSTKKEGPVELKNWDYYSVPDEIKEPTVVLYAIWTPKKYTIEFKANNGEGSMNTVELEYDQEYTLPNSGFTRKGYTFLGWSNSSWNQVDYEAGTVVKNLATSGTKSLFAVWREDFYTVTLCSNNGLNQTKQYEASCANAKYIPSVDFKKEGYHLDGWSLTENGEKLYDKTGNIDPIVNEPGNVNLYAVWVPNTYTITFDPGDGTGEMDAIVCVYDTPTKLPKCTFTKEGYSFYGWANSFWPNPNNKLVDDEGDALNLTSVNEGSVRLSAIWVEGTYTVVFHSNDENNKTTSQSIPVNTEKYLEKNKFKRTGYSFSGWSATKDGKPEYKDQENVKKLTEVGGTVDLYAVWTPNKYTVYFYRYGSFEGQDFNDEFTYDQPKKLPKNTFYRPGYVFDGWSEKAAGLPKYQDEQEVVNLAEIGSYSLYAHWKKIVLGDVDGDGSVTPADARIALRRAVGLVEYDKYSREYAATDADKDGNITPADARLILRVAVKLDTLYW